MQIPCLSIVVLLAKCTSPLADAALTWATMLGLACTLVVGYWLIKAWAKNMRVNLFYKYVSTSLGQELRAEAVTGASHIASSMHTECQNKGYAVDFYAEYSKAGPNFTSLAPYHQWESVGYQFRVTDDDDNEYQIRVTRLVDYSACKEQTYT